MLKSAYWFGWYKENIIGFRLKWCASSAFMLISGSLTIWHVTGSFGHQGYCHFAVHISSYGDIMVKDVSLCTLSGFYSVGAGGKQNIKREQIKGSPTPVISFLWTDLIHIFLSLYNKDLSRLSLLPPSFCIFLPCPSPQWLIFIHDLYYLQFFSRENLS